MLSSEDKVIVDEFSRRVRERFSGARVWVFGSRARGNATWDSDFDICVVLQKTSRSNYRKLRQIAWEIGFENGVVITTVTYSRREFESGPRSASPLTRKIRLEGMAP